jgi:hypothetical protein
LQKPASQWMMPQRSLAVRRDEERDLRRTASCGHIAAGRPGPAVQSTPAQAATVEAAAPGGSWVPRVHGRIDDQPIGEWRSHTGCLGRGSSRRGSPPDRPRARRSSPRLRATGPQEPGPTLGHPCRTSCGPSARGLAEGGWQPRHRRRENTGDGQQRRANLPTATARPSRGDHGDAALTRPAGCPPPARSCPSLITPRSGGKQRPMRRDDWFRVIDEAGEMGPLPVQFIGGEPTLHPDLPGLIERAFRRGLAVEVFSNLVRIHPSLWETFARCRARLATSY